MSRPLKPSFGPAPRLRSRDKNCTSPTSSPISALHDRVPATLSQSQQGQFSRHGAQTESLLLVLPRDRTPPRPPFHLPDSTGNHTTSPRCPLFLATHTVRTPDKVGCSGSNGCLVTHPTRASTPPVSSRETAGAGEHEGRQRALESSRNGEHAGRDCRFDQCCRRLGARPPP